MQSVRKIVYVLAQLYESPVNGTICIRRWRQVTSGKLGGIDCQAGDPLRQVIVQFAREPASLVFMRGDQASAQCLCFSFGAAPVDALPHESYRQGSLQYKDSDCRHDQD